MFNKIKKGFKGVKQFMKEKVRVCKELLSNPKNRAVAGVVVIGLGVGLVVSAYMPLPA